MSTPKSPDLKPNPTFFAWNRLEGRPRSTQFSKSLRAEVHDPLWMLGRQMQMGEWRGEDTGSGIFARVQMQYSPISGIALYDKDAQTYAAPYSQVPLEAVVESIPYNWSMKERALLGRKWKSILVANNQWDSVPGSAYKAWFTAPHTAFLINVDESSTDEGKIRTAAAALGDPVARSLYSGLSYSAANIDGGFLYQKLRLAGWTAELDSRKPSGSTLTAAGLATSRTQFLDWIAKMFVLPVEQGGQVGAWNPEQLEYQFDTYWSYKNGTAVTTQRLSAKEYSQGNFDWFALQSDQPKPGTMTLPSGEADRKSMQVLMSDVRFPGMPSSRWWEFENGSVNFCNLDGNTTDIAKIIVTQFALIYQDDWFVIPYTVPLGSISKVAGIVVTDVFGRRTFVPNHKVNGFNGGFTTGSEDWKTWNWMEISQKGDYINQNPPLPQLTLLPTSKSVMESKPMESVQFIRDEMANMVWAIEKSVCNAMGAGTDGYEQANSLLRYLRAKKPGTATTAAPAVNAPLRYEVVSDVPPENWIPFVPVHAPGSWRETVLRRATLPRIMPAYTTPSFIAPRTGILSYGISDDPNIASAFYDVHEEEIPRSGTIVETTYQRARWHNGRTAVWVGRRKTNGRGEGASGLQYDKVTTL